MSEEKNLRTNECHAEEKDPFEGYRIANWEILEELNERSACSNCTKSRKYFCYTCYVPVPQLKDVIPKVKLPVKIDIIKHAKEIDGKSTAVHAAVLAPDDVTVYTYPCIPNYSKEEKVVLIFPGKNALTIPEYLVKQNSLDSDESEPVCKKERRNDFGITRAIFIDSTWNQSRGIYKDQRLRSLPCVVLQSRISEFWRHQHGSPRWFLATIEAVHQFLVELTVYCQDIDNLSNLKCESKQSRDKKSPASPRSDSVNHPQDQDASTNIDQSPVYEGHPEKPPSKFIRNLASCRDGLNKEFEINLLGPDEWKGKYDGRYDNLLFFFRFMYSKIHKVYDPKKLRSYKRRVV